METFFSTLFLHNNQILTYRNYLHENLTILHYALQEDMMQCDIR